MTKSETITKPNSFAFISQSSGVIAGPTINAAIAAARPKNRLVGDAAFAEKI
jgi:hypothetical protein